MQAAGNHRHKIRNHGCRRIGDTGTLSVQPFQIPRALFNRAVFKAVACRRHGLRERRRAGWLVGDRLREMHYIGSYNEALPVAPERDQVSRIERFDGGGGTRSDAFRAVE